MFVIPGCTSFIGGHTVCRLTKQEPLISGYITPKFPDINVRTPDLVKSNILDTPHLIILKSRNFLNWVFKLICQILGSIEMSG